MLLYSSCSSPRGRNATVPAELLETSDIKPEMPIHVCTEK